MIDVQKTGAGNEANPRDPFVWMVDKIIELEKRVAKLEAKPVQPEINLKFNEVDTELLTKTLCQKLHLQSGQ